MTILELIEELSQNSSKTMKLKILMGHSDNALLKRVVVMAMNPLTVYNIKKIPHYTTSDKPMLSLADALDELNKLSSRQISGNAAIAHLQNILATTQQDDAKVIELVIGKDLKCGVSIKTMNKVWAGLILDYPCLLASQYNEKTIKNIKYPAMVQQKIDGTRINAIVEGQTCTFYARSGKQVFLSKRLELDFIAMAGGESLVFDGELLVYNGVETAIRQQGNGIINKAIKGTISAAESDSIIFMAWDVIPLHDFNKQYSGDGYSIRYARLSALYESYNSDKIFIVETHYADSFDDVQRLFTGALESGFEGVMLKNSDSIWENKRSKGHIKFKNELTCELRVVGIVEGCGKYEKMVGSLTCESEDGQLKVGVGSGLSDNQRVEYKNIMGSIITVKYNEKIKNEQGEWSLFLPIFMAERPDKDTADSISSIK